MFHLLELREDGCGERPLLLTRLCRVELTAPGVERALKKREVLFSIVTLVTQKLIGGSQGRRTKFLLPPDSR